MFSGISFWFFLFLMWTFKEKVLIEFVRILLLFYVLVFWLQGMWDLKCLTRDWTHIPYIRRCSPNHWPAREVPSHFGFNFAFPKWCLVPFHMPIVWLDTSFWGEAMKQKRIALLFCQAKGDRTGFCLEKLCLNPRELESYKGSKVGSDKIRVWAGLVLL